MIRLRNCHVKISFCHLITGSSVIWSSNPIFSSQPIEIVSKNITNKILNLFYSRTSSINNRTVKEQKTAKTGPRCLYKNRKPVANSIVPIKIEWDFLLEKNERIASTMFMFGKNVVFKQFDYFLIGDTPHHIFSG